MYGIVVPTSLNLILFFVCGCLSNPLNDERILYNNLRHHWLRMGKRKWSKEQVARCLAGARTVATKLQTTHISSLSSSLPPLCPTLLWHSRSGGTALKHWRMWKAVAELLRFRPHWLSTRRLVAPATESYEIEKGLTALYQATAHPACTSTLAPSPRHTCAEGNKLQ